MNLDEAVRQLDLYRKAMNEIDDMVEYGSFGKQDLYEVMARLSDALVCGPRYTITDAGRIEAGREMLKEGE